jgi:hypothetical protein
VFGSNNPNTVAGTVSKRADDSNFCARIRHTALIM